MIRVKSLNLGLNRTLLLTVGLWPYERSTLVRLQLFLLYGIMATFLIFQLTPFTTSQLTSQFIIEVLPNLIFFIILMIKYTMFYLNMDTVKHELEVLQHIYDGLRDKNEIAIIEKYGNIAKRYTNLLTLFAVCAIFGIAFFQIWLCILDIIAPLNKTRSESIINIKTEYFIDQEKYFYLIVMHGSVAVFVGGIVVLATGAIILVCLQYTCGMFEIASYRIKHAITINTLQDTITRNENLIYKKMIYAINIHRNATEFLTLLISSFNIYYLFIAITLILSLSFNFFREISSECDAMKLLTPLTIVIVNYIYIFIGNDCSQQVMDHNDNVFASVYNVQWYITPLPVQKMTLFLLQKGTKGFKVNIGGLIAASLENAATMTSASITYFTVLYSTRQ